MSQLQNYNQNLVIANPSYVEGEAISLKLVKIASFPRLISGILAMTVII